LSVLAAFPHTVPVAVHVQLAAITQALFRNTEKQTQRFNTHPIRI